MRVISLLLHKSKAQLSMDVMIIISASIQDISSVNLGVWEI